MGLRGRRPTRMSLPLNRRCAQPSWTVALEPNNLRSLTVSNALPSNISSEKSRKITHSIRRRPNLILIGSARYYKNHLSSFRGPAQSLQVVRSPCCPRELPDAISESLSLDAGSPTPAVPPCALTCFFHGVIGLPHDTNGSAPASVPRITTSRRDLFRGCRYFVMFRPPSLLAPQIVPTAAIPPQGSRGFYVRAYRALLPPHAPDMLTVRRQVIDGTGTCTLLDSQPCRLLHWDRNRARPAVGEGFPFPALSIAGRVHIPTMADVSRRPPIIPDGRISRVRFETLAFLPWAFPKFGEV